MDVLFLLNVFRVCSKVKLRSTKNSERKNLFLSACHSLNENFSLHEIDQKVPFEGLIGYGDSHLDKLFRFSKVFGHHATLHDAAVLLFARRTRILLFDWSRSKFVFIGSPHDWTFVLTLIQIDSSLHIQFSRLFVMSLIVLDIALAEKNVVKKSSVFLDGQVFGYSFEPPKNYQATHQTIWCPTQNLHKIDWKSCALVYSHINTMLGGLRQYREEYFAKELENVNF